jgi:eukaryotic-like serine/threonine-protein kinase
VPRPEPLVLAGVADSADPYPTQAVSHATTDPTAPLFDQDAATEAIAIDFPPIGATRTLRGRLGLPPRTAKQRARQRRMVPLVVLAAFAVATALGTSALAQVGAAGRATPGLVGLAQPAATHAAAHDGLTLHVVHRASPDPSGTVLSQSPAPGDWLYGGHSISVVVSSGPSPIDTPNVFGLARRDAIAALNRVGLVAAGAHGYNQTAKVGTVFAQDPPHSAQILPGKTVTITWSDGPSPVKVPDLHGLSCTAAMAQLVSHHLRSAATCTKVYNTAPVDEVVASTPVPGTVLKQGSTVTLQISKGPQPVKVPDVRGFRAADAVKRLHDLGFNVASPNYNQKGHVFDQSPAGGTSIPKGSTVTLIF